MHPEGRALPAIVGLAALLSVPSAGMAQPAPSLGAAASFAVLGGSAVSSANKSVVSGNLGVSPGGTITGISSDDVKLGQIFRNDATARQAQRDAVAAYNDLASRACEATTLTGDLKPGVYCVSPPARLTGTLTLDAGGNANAIWVFKVAGALTTDPDSSVRVINGGQAGCVFWQVGNSAILGARSLFMGNILARASITLNAGATVSGRLLAQTGAVALDTNNVSLCCEAITVINPATMTGSINALFSETFTQTGAIGSTSFTTVSTLPEGLTLAPNGTLSGTPKQGGTFDVTVRATDANKCAGASAVYHLVINCQNITVTNPDTATGTVGTPFSETFTQSGGIGTITWTETGALPKGLMLHAPTGVLDGIPLEKGPFPITVTATDSNGCAGTGPLYNLMIICQPITVTAASPVMPNGIAGVFYSQKFMQSGGVGTINWSETGALPRGLMFHHDTGVLDGTPLETGSFPITVTATDTNGCTGALIFNLVINCQIVTVTNPVVTTGTAGTAFSQTFTASGILGTATFTTSSTLPSGFSLSSGGVLSGTTAQVDTFPIIVRATDTNGCFGEGATYNLMIVCQTITVTNPVTTVGTINTPFSQTFTATGILGTETFTLASGTLPTGLTLHTSTGVLDGTPTQTGSFPITVTATDANGCFGTGASYPLVINPGCPTISPPTLPSATLGVPYSETITASGGTPSYGFAITSGALPPGLSLSPTGVISGTPTTLGCFTFTVTVTDTSGCARSATYTICVATGGPTLSGWGLIALSVLLVGAGFVAIRRSGG